MSLVSSHSCISLRWLSLCLDSNQCAYVDKRSDAVDRLLIVNLSCTFFVYRPAHVIERIFCLTMNYTYGTSAMWEGHNRQKCFWVNTHVDGEKQYGRAYVWVHWMERKRDGQRKRWEDHAQRPKGKFTLWKILNEREWQYHSDWKKKCDLLLSSIKSRNEIGHFCKQPVLRHAANMADTIPLMYTTYVYFDTW